MGSADTSFLVRVLGPPGKGLWLGGRHRALVQGGVRIGPGERRETVSLSPRGDKGVILAPLHLGPTRQKRVTAVGHFCELRPEQNPEEQQSPCPSLGDVSALGKGWCLPAETLKRAGLPVPQRPSRSPLPVTNKPRKVLLQPTQCCPAPRRGSSLCPNDIIFPELQRPGGRLPKKPEAALGSWADTQRAGPAAQPTWG